MNLPNKLTVLRMCLIPVFLVFMLADFMPWIAQRIIVAALFVGTAITDMLDGKIARKHNLITDFGKFLDPLADKLMVFGAFLGLIYMYRTDYPFSLLMVIASFVVIFRELAVTSIRLVVSGSKGIVIAANYLGKIKTVTQIVCVCACIAEPYLYQFITPLGFLGEYLPLSIATSAVMLFFTLWSGINYIVSYWKYLDPEK